jgi:hypothetical protein
MINDKCRMSNPQTAVRSSTRNLHLFNVDIQFRSSREYYYRMHFVPLANTETSCRLLYIIQKDHLTGLPSYQRYHSEPKLLLAPSLQRGQDSCWVESADNQAFGKGNPEFGSHIDLDEGFRKADRRRLAWQMGGG